MPPNSRNIEMLSAVATGLQGLNEKVAFVGGATIDLYIVDPAAPPARATDDVDCVVELASAVKFHELEEKLRLLEFKNVSEEGNPICRWLFKGIKVDVMPVDGGILNFKNRWYPDGFANTISIQLPNGAPAINIFKLPYLLATKLEAFADRGKGDYLGSSDIEDIVALMDGCPGLEAEVNQAPVEVRKYLAERFGALLNEPRFVESVPGHIFDAAGSQVRAKRILDLMKLLSA